MSQFARALPYLQVSAERVTAKEWRIKQNDEALILEENIPGWDARMDLELSRNVSLDIEGIWQDCQLPHDCQIRIVPLWFSKGTTNLRGRGSPISLGRSTMQDIPLQMRIPGDKIAGSVLIRTVIVLAQTLSPVPLRPTKAGSILWEDDITVSLTDFGARFPLEFVSFQKSAWNWPNGAGWKLEWDRSDLEIPLLGGLRLFLNSDHSMIRSVVEKPGESTAQLILSMIYYEVGRSLILGALQNSEFLEKGRTFPEYSVGQTIKRMIRVYLRRSPSELKAFWEQDPDGFNSLLQEKLHLLRDTKE